MTKLEKLIEELCPNGVEYQTIYEVVGVNRGKRLTKRELSDDAEYEVYHGSKDSILGKYYKYNAPANTTIVVNTGGIGGVKFLDKPFWCSDGSFWLGQAEYVDNKYIYYCLSGYEDYFYSQKRVGGVPTIDRDVVGNFKIPVPPLEVQNEIVRILDNFTELTARKKQYDYYRDELLTFDDDIPVVPLAEIGNVRMCKRILKNQTNTQGGVPFYKIGTFGKKADAYISEELFEEYKLKAEETKKFIDNSFRDGLLKTTGTDIDKLMPSVSRFGGGNRAEKKQTVVEKLKKFFEKYFGLV